MAGKMSGDRRNWFRSSKCGADLGCVEVAVEATLVYVRTTEKPHEELAFTRAEWRTFVANLR
jgi:hypothetical protein